MPAFRPVSVVGIILLGLTLWTPHPALSAGPATQLQTQVERFVTLMAERDPAPPGARRAALRTLAEEIFDFRETAKRILGKHWATLSSEEQARFVQAFTDFIDRAYLGKAEAHGGPAGRVVVVEEKIRGNDAHVWMQLVADGDRTPLEFRMVRNGETQWRAYDVRMGAISLVGAYRAQFTRILRDRSWEELLTRLEPKAEAASIRSH